MKVRLTSNGIFMLTKVVDVDTGRVIPVRGFSLRGNVENRDLVLVLEIVDFEVDVEVDVEVDARVLRKANTEGKP